jgi:excisionase family DNA binding protein
MGGLRHFLAYTFRMALRPKRMAEWYAEYAGLPRKKRGKKRPPAPDAPLSIAQAAEQFNLNARTLYALCANGSLKHTRIGRTIRVASAELKRLVSQGPRQKTGLLD